MFPRRHDFDDFASFRLAAVKYRRRLYPCYRDFKTDMAYYSSVSAFLEEPIPDDPGCNEDDGYSYDILLRTWAGRSCNSQEPSILGERSVIPAREEFVGVYAFKKELERFHRKPWPRLSDHHSEEQFYLSVSHFRREPIPNRSDIQGEAEYRRSLYSWALRRDADRLKVKALDQSAEVRLACGTQNNSEPVKTTSSRATDSCGSRCTSFLKGCVKEEREKNGGELFHFLQCGSDVRKVRLTGRGISKIGSAYYQCGVFEPMPFLFDVQKFFLKTEETVMAATSDAEYGYQVFDDSKCQESDAVALPHARKSYYLCPYCPDFDGTAQQKTFVNVYTLVRHLYGKRKTTSHWERNGCPYFAAAEKEAFLQHHTPKLLPICVDGGVRSLVPYPRKKPVLSSPL